MLLDLTMQRRQKGSNLLFCLVYLHHVLGTGSFNTTNSTTYVASGETVVINCTCFTQNDSEWQGPNGQLYSAGLRINPSLNKSHIEITGNYKLGLCNLRITNFSLKDNGTYKCQYINKGDVLIAIYNVFLKRPPTDMKILNSTENGKLQGFANKSLDLVCTVESGYPPETLQWSKNGTIITYGGHGQIIHTILPERSDNKAVFTCSAFSELLNLPITQDVHLDIHYKPYITIPKIQQEHLIEGRNVTICCKVISNPSVQSIYWTMKNKTPLNSSGDGTNCFSLLTVDRNQSGYYTCHAVNNVGTSNKTTNLSIKYPPNVVVTSHNCSTAVGFKCKANGFPNDYTFLEWEHKSELNEHIRFLNGTSDNSLIINKNDNYMAQYQNTGFYICRVSNGVKDINNNLFQQGKHYIIFGARPFFVGENKKIQFGSYGNNADITVDVYSKPSPNTTMIKKSGSLNILSNASVSKVIRLFDIFHGKNITVTGFRLTYNVELVSGADFCDYTVTVCNVYGCSHFDVEVRSASQPQPPENISVSAGSTSIELKWNAGFNGGYIQQFCVEYASGRSSSFMKYGPFSEENCIIRNLSPDTIYRVRIFARNKVGSSNKTTFIVNTTSEVYSLNHDQDNNIGLFVAMAIFLGIVIAAITIWKKVRHKQSYSAGATEDTEEDIRGDAVENRLYQSTSYMPVELQELRIPTVASASMLTSEQNEERVVTSARAQSSNRSILETSDGRIPQIIDGHLNYAEVVFEARQHDQAAIIHGVENSTVYSEVDFAAKVDPLISSSETESDSDGDFMYLTGIENFCPKRKSIQMPNGHDDE